MVKWFEEVFGFTEEDINSPEVKIKVQTDAKGYSHIKVPTGKFQIGRLETPTIDEVMRRLRSESIASLVGKSSRTRWFVESDNTITKARRIKCVEIVANINNIFSNPKQSKDAVVQVASQFNLLEMADPDTTPTDGISIYYYDRTQGPVCAMQTPYGTLFRNYFANVVSDYTKVDGTGTLETGTGQGQLKTQINCGSDLLGAFDHSVSDLGSRINYTYMNGYLFIKDEDSLRQITKLIATSPSESSDYQKYMRIGVHWGTQVVNSDHTCTLALCSAIPIAYHNNLRRSNYWKDFAMVILGAAYRLTLLVAVENYEKTGCPRVYLTAIGGGVFGNKPEWICEAMRIALIEVSHVSLEVFFVSYGRSDPLYSALMRDMSV